MTALRTLQDLRDAARGFWTARTILTACELDVFGAVARADGGGDIAALAHTLQALQFVDALAHRAPVGQHPTQPPNGNVGHAAAGCLIFDRFYGLSFGSYK